MSEQEKKETLITTHHEARRDYYVLETYEAGIVLSGPEVKSLRMGKASLSGSFARFEEEELFIYHLYIPPYVYAGTDGPDPKRTRKLLLKHRELERLKNRVTEKGQTLIPLKIYFNIRGIVKVELALAKGKKLYDKRTEIKKSEVARLIQRTLKHDTRR